MSLSSVSIRRPVLATVMSVVLVIFGVVGYTFKTSDGIEYKFEKLPER